jgi:hypothetical protein
MFLLAARADMVMSAGVMTTAELHKHIEKCFSKLYNDWLDADADAEGMRDKHFNLEGMSRRLVVEHLASTYDWDNFLLQTKSTQGRAFCYIENIAQLRDPDVYRPHYWEFSIKEGVVVLNLKHWSADTEFWNESPMPVWNRIPMLADLRPAKMEWSKSLVQMHARLRWCQEWYVKNGLRCRETAEGVKECPRCHATSCDCRCCIRCEQMSILHKYMEYRAAMSVTEADLSWWKSHFDSLTQAQVDSTLIPLEQMKLPTCDRIMGELPSFQEQMDNLPAMMKQAPVGLKCKVAVLGLGPNAFKNVVGKVAPRYRDTTQNGIQLEINMLVGALRTTRTNIDFAVLLRNGEGAWLTSKQLLAHEAQQISCVGEELRPQWFGIDVLFDQVIVQEDSKRLYTARLDSYNHETEEWTLHFPRQRANNVFGTSACEHEVHIMDLEELNYQRGMVRAPSSSEVHPVQDTIRMTAVRQGRLQEIVMPPCQVNVSCPAPTIRHGLKDSRQKHHRFWVSRLHFGMEFIQKKLKPHMQHMKNQAIDVIKLRKYASCCSCAY